ncbi:MAG: metal-dependent transcriptional regulator [Candidatus Methanomethylophilaceae archaeon]|nr:metal-dependent transcriptional regulator [Candidatus Methanomethylophilaceae archaeon]
MTSDSREDYLISILRLSDGEKNVKTTELAEFMNVSPASVTEMTKTLAAEGLVIYERYRGIRLSEEGMSIARQLRKKHHVIEHLLVDCLGMDHQDAHEEAHKIEHSISDDTSIRICNMVGNPVDEDCAYCSDPCKRYNQGSMNIVQLNTMAKNKGGIIAYIKSDNSDDIRKLNSIGFVPGREVKIESILMDGGDRIIKIGDNMVALSYDLASTVFVDVS